MGTIFGKAKDENLKRKHEFLLEMQKIQVERQLHMQNLMRERMMATQIAQSRELLYWLGSFAAIASGAMIVGYKRTWKPGVLAPLLPLGFVVAYQADLAYGNKLHRIRGEAENIMNFEESLLELPVGLPTILNIDQARNQEKDDERTSKVHDIYI